MQCSGITTNWLVQQPVKCGKLNWLPFLLSATAFINDITDLLHNEDSVLSVWYVRQIVRISQHHF